jgi:hypothetical protein
MTQNFDPIIWPQTGATITEKQAIFVYEVARLQAAAMNAPVVPEPWDQRDEAFRRQFLDIIDCYCMMDELPTPEEAHDSWWDAYKELGWVYGPVRDVEKKTHPDMVPFNELGYEEQIKDAVFLGLVAMARDYIHD